MDTNPYQVLGMGNAIMRGREALFQQLLRRLVKRTPDHSSVVGPTLIGKSVFLAHLAEKVVAGFEDYLTSASWDVSVNTPESDLVFLQRFAQEMGTAIRPYRPDLAEYLKFGNRPPRSPRHGE